MNYSNPYINQGVFNSSKRMLSSSSKTIQYFYKTNSDTKQVYNEIYSKLNKFLLDDTSLSVNDHLIKRIFDRKDINTKPLLLNLKYRFEAINKLNLINDKKEIFDKTVDYLQSALSPLRVTNDTLKITSSGTLYIKFLLDEIYFVRFEVFLNEVEGFSLNTIEVAINIEEGGSQIFGTVCSLKGVVEHLFEQTENLRITKTYPDSSFAEEEVTSTYELDTSS